MQKEKVKTLRFLNVNTNDREIKEIKIIVKNVKCRDFFKPCNRRR